MPVGRTSMLIKRHPAFAYASSASYTRGQSVVRAVFGLTPMNSYSKRCAEPSADPVSWPPTARVCPPTAVPVKRSAAHAMS